MSCMYVCMLQEMELSQRTVFVVVVVVVVVFLLIIMVY